jgi:hypothetical protein
LAPIQRIVDELRRLADSEALEPDTRRSFTQN